jgi:hypothetical protein
MAIVDVVTTSVILAGLFPWAWMHPGGSGYWFYSGVFDASISVAIVSGVGVFWRAHNHVRGCWRLDWHPHPEHGHPVCFVHHPDGGSEFLHKRHHQVKVSSPPSPANPVPLRPASGRSRRS